MADHDPLCEWQPDQPQRDGSIIAWQCQCDAIVKARADERRAIERRVRHSGVARWLPSNAWDLLVASIRGESR